MPASRPSPAALLTAAAVVAVALFLASAAPAQSATGTLVGTVRHPDGTPVPGARVEVTSPQTGARRVTATDERGRFRLDSLSPGDWQVDAALDGAKSPPGKVTVALQEIVELDLVLGSSLTEEVTVSSAPLLVDSRQTASELRIGREEVENLPVAGRNVTDLALLSSANLAMEPGGLLGERNAVFATNGQSGRANSFLVDGLDNNDLTSGTTLNSFLSQQVIREFVVQSHPFSPEFGRASGGVLNLVTERGTNDISLRGFIQGANTQLNTGSGFVDALPATPGENRVGSRVQTGLSWSGPMRRDRAFYFFAYEHQEIHDIVPFTGTDGTGALGGFLQAPHRDDNFFLRTDFNLGAANFLMVRLSADQRQDDGLNVGGVFTPEAGFNLLEKDVQLAASLTSVLGSGVINEARMLAGTSGFEQAARSDRSGVERPSGIFGGNDLNHQARDEERLQLLNNLTWNRGAHTLKFGLGVTRSRTAVRTRFNPMGAFLYETDLPFEPGDCGDLLASDVSAHFQAGNGAFDPIPCPGQVGIDDDGDGSIDEPGIIGTYPVVYRFISGRPSATLNNTSYQAFVQDSWAASERLQLDYGLRYDLDTYTLPSGSGIPGSIPNGGAGQDTDNVSPRLGFAYALGAKRRTVLRGGAGMFTDKLVLGFPATAAITSGTEIGILPVQGFTLEFTEKELEEIGIDAVLGSLFFPTSLTLRFSTGTELETPYTVQYHLGFEHALSPHSSFSIGATHVLGYHQVLLRDLNPVLGTDTLGIPIHRDATVGSIAAFVTEGRNWYTGLDLGWQWRGGGRRAAVTYTWSRATDMGFDPLKDGISLPPDSDRIELERGPSDSDRRHRLVFHGETALPVLGLRASGVMRISSGAPFNVTTSTDERDDGVTTFRPVGVARNTGENTPLAPVNALRLAAGLPAVSRLKQPVFAQMDLRVWRPFTMKQASGEFFVQIFNVLDRQNGGPVEGRVLSSRFGQPVGLLGPPRTLELGLKFGF